MKHFSNRLDNALSGSPERVHGACQEIGRRTLQGVAVALIVPGMTLVILGTAILTAGQKDLDEALNNPPQ